MRNQDIPLLNHGSFLFLRHGQTVANAAEIIAGSLDSELTQLGLDQAEAAAQILKNHTIGSIWHSPLSRAKITAQASADLTKVRMVELSGLAERDWGDWEGQPRQILRRQETPPNGEGPEVFRDRIRDALAQISGPFPALIVAHSGTAREIHHLLSDEPFERLDNAVPVQWIKAECHWKCVKLS